MPDEYVATMTMDGKAEFLQRGSYAHCQMAVSARTKLVRSAHNLPADKKSEISFKIIPASEWQG